MLETSTAQLNSAQTAALREILSRINDRDAVLTLAGLAGTGRYVDRAYLAHTPEPVDA